MRQVVTNNPKLTIDLSECCSDHTFICEKIKAPSKILCRLNGFTYIFTFGVSIIDVQQRSEGLQTTLAEFLGSGWIVFQVDSFDTAYRYIRNEKSS